MTVTHVAQRRPCPPGRRTADDLLTPTELVAIHHDGLVTPLRQPPPGTSDQRPVVAADGTVAWYTVPARIKSPIPWLFPDSPGSTDWHPDRVELLVAGRAQPRLHREVSRNWLFAEVDTWSARGHAEWWGDRLVEAVKVERRGFLGIPVANPAPTWQCITLTPGARADSANDITGTWGWAEPSVHPDGMCFAEAGGRTVRHPYGTFTAPAGAAQVYDPYLSPDATMVVCLTRHPTGRWGLWLQDLAEPDRSRWLVDPDQRNVEVTHARWDGDDAVVCSMKVYDGPAEQRTTAHYYSAFRLWLDGRRDRLTLPEDGSVEQVCPVPPGVTRLVLT